MIGWSHDHADHIPISEDIACSEPVGEEHCLEIIQDFENTGILWFWATDPQGLLSYMSPKATDNLHCQAAQLIGQPLVALFETDPTDPGKRSDRSLGFLLGARSIIMELPVGFVFGQSRDNRLRAWWTISGLPKYEADGSFGGYRGWAKDVTIEYEHKVEDSRRAEFDSLTDLANRHRMERRLDRIIAAFQTTVRCCAVLMLDLDRFKLVNDMLGHRAGDELLRQAARRLETIVGRSGEIGRLGGDEFQIILPNLDDRKKLGELAGKLVHTLSQPYLLEGKRAIIGASVGIAVAPFDGDTKEDVYQSADLALYAAKNAGRGQFRFYSANLKDDIEERRLLENGLQVAVANSELEMHYQPIIRLGDGVVVGFEALMRWEHAERGYISPELFIPIAEETNLINDLGEWALRRACAEAVKWPQSVRVAVNVSAVQFINNAFPVMVGNALQESGLDAARLELELTESIFLGDQDFTEGTFATLKGLGVRLALDDFGTGYSSLSYLRSAPFDNIKIDRCFVEECAQRDKNSAKIIAAIIGLAEALGMETTIEGVEAFDQLEVVRAMGARFIQGYIYSRPLKNEEIVARMESGLFRIEPDGPSRHRADRRSVFLRIRMIYDGHRHEAVMRELSKTGARLEGVYGIPEGAALVLDLGSGQLVECIVIHAKGAIVGVEFDQALVNDGAGGLCTRQRVPPNGVAEGGRVARVLAAAKMAQ